MKSVYYLVCFLLHIIGRTTVFLRLLIQCTSILDVLQECLNNLLGIFLNSHHNEI